MTHTPTQAVSNSPQSTYREGSITSEMEILAKCVSNLRATINNLDDDLDSVRVKAATVSGEVKEPAPPAPPAPHRCMVAECIAGVSAEIKLLTAQVRALSNELQLK